MGFNFEWKVIPALPCRIRLLKSAKPVVEFYETSEYERLVAAAESCDPRTHIIMLLGGDAGLRLGEMLGLEQADLDSGRGLIKVQRAVYEDGEDGPTVTLPKGGRPRIVPMASRLKRALATHRHLRGDRVLYDDAGRPAWEVVAQVAARLGGAPGRATQGRARPHPPAHVLLAAGGSERADAVHQRAGRSPVAGDDAAAHASLLRSAEAGHRRVGAGRGGGDERGGLGEGQGRRVVKL